MGTRIGFVASEKGAEKECDVGLGLRMQKTSKTSTNNTNISLGGTKKTMMMMVDHHDGHDDPTRLLVSNGGFAEEQQHCVGGPLFCNTSNNVTSMSDIYDVGSLLFPTTDSYLSYNSSGVMVSSANVRHSIPFTASQRLELETQTMIYRYMMNSVPVPPQLLIPITKTTPNFTNRSLELGISSNSSDSEPWRCKRTDGKKWRCSRNVVPEQKYCERHSHKTRPRSRKHVEQQNSHFNNTTNTSPYSKPSSFAEKPQPPFSAALHDQPRSLDWFVKGLNPAVNPNQDWHQIFQTKPQPQGGSIRTPEDFSPQNFSLDETRHYIDAWSDSAERDHASVESSAPFSSALSLSIHSREENSENGQMGFGIETNLLTRSQWNTDSWDSGSPPGGPLAEALCLGMAPSSTKESSSRSS